MGPSFLVRCLHVIRRPSRWCHLSGAHYNLLIAWIYTAGVRESRLHWLVDFINQLGLMNHTYIYIYIYTSAGPGEVSLDLSWLRKYAKEQATAESQGVESRLKTSTGKLEVHLDLRHPETRQQMTRIEMGKSTTNQQIWDSYLKIAFHQPTWICKTDLCYLCIQHPE